MLDRFKAQALLEECTGDDIWSLVYCREKGIPAAWLEELQDCFESNFQNDSQTIYVEEHATNQYEGIRDVDLAIKLGAFLDVDIDSLKSQSWTRADLVRHIQETVDEG
ncbi:MAG: hypothetical protein AAF394_10690 [Planctomycetota bacterium]